MTSGNYAGGYVQYPQQGGDIFIDFHFNFIIKWLCVSSMVKCLKHCDCDCHGLSSKSICSILLFPLKDT